MFGPGAKRKRNNAGNGDGFTLIELLVALTILAFVMGGVYSVFRTAHESISLVDRHTALTQIGRALVSDLSREIASVYPLEIDLSGSEGGAGLSAAQLAQMGERMITFVGQDEVSSDGREVDTLRFTTVTQDPRRRAEEGGTMPSFDLAEVLYYIDDDDSTPERGLVRQSNDLPGLAAEGMVPTTQEISDRVIAMNFRYLDDSGEEPEWVDLWENTETLPVALELTLFLTPDPELRDLDTVLERGRVVSALVRFPIRQPLVPVGAKKESQAGPGGSEEGGGEETGRPEEGGSGGADGGGAPEGPGGSGLPGGSRGR